MGMMPGRSGVMRLDLHEFREGWKVVVACFIGMALSLMALAGTYSVGVLAGPLTAEFGWSRGDVMLVPTLLYAGLIPSSFAVGWIADHYGVRKMTMFSLVALALGFVALGTLSQGSLTAFLTIYLLIGIFGEAAGPISYTRSIVGWFKRNRGLALGLIMSGTGLSAILIPAYTGWFVEKHGWREAYLALAVLPVCITLPAVWFLLKEVPGVAARESGGAIQDLHGLSFREAIRGYRFWVMVAVFSALTAIVISVITNLVPMLTDAGYELSTAVLMGSAWGFATVIGRISFGFLLDRFWAPKVAVFVLLPAAAACIMLSNPHWGMWSTILAIALVGLMNGAEFDLLIYMMTRYFGSKSYGTLFALMYVLYNTAAATGPAIYGYTFDAFGNYQPVLWVSAALIILSALALLTLGKYPSHQESEVRTTGDD